MVAELPNFPRADILEPNLTNAAPRTNGLLWKFHSNSAAARPLSDRWILAVNGARGLFREMSSRGEYPI